MARTEIAGIGIEYELLGDADAPAVAITPGGRFSKEAPGVRELGEALAAAGRRVLLWDRPNCGASDFCFDGNSESKLQAQVLCELIESLDLGPIALVGGSGGARVSMLGAAHRPELVSHVVMWWISGGITGLMMLGSFYCCDSAASASMGGMERVAAMPLWADQLERNPRNRKIMLSQDPKQFIACMERWARDFIPSDGPNPAGMSSEDVASVTMPVMIFRGSENDIFHPAYVCERVSQLFPRAELADAPWPDDIFAERMTAGTGLFTDWPLAAPAIAGFIAR